MIDGKSLKELFYHSTLPRECYGIYVATWMAATSRFPMGTNIFSRSDDWDVAVILDACRVDVLKSVAPEYGFIQDVSSIRSVGTTSMEWVLKTFVESHRQEIESTHLVTANPFSDHLDSLPVDYLDFAEIEGASIKDKSWLNRLFPHNNVPTDDFAGYDPLFKYRRDTHEYGRIVLPEDVTDRVIRTHRDGADKIVAHYMQPHDPFIASARQRPDGDQGFKPYERHPFDSLRANEVTKDQVWDAYQENLRGVLDSVRTLLTNVDGRVIITADHGELFGEWGLYSHGPGLLHPSLWRVPWVETTAEDQQTYEPSIEFEDVEMNEEDVKETLEALGYL